MLRDAGIMCRDFPAELRAKAEGDNREFLDSFRSASGDSGEVWFDHTQDGGRFLVRTDSAGDFKTSWGLCGQHSVYAYGSPGTVAHARYATAFDDIHDPSNNDFGSHYAALTEGQVGVYRGEDGYLLIRVVAVTTPEGADGYPSLRFQYEARAKDRNSSVSVDAVSPSA
jgi:hypothetical protein